MLTDNTSQEQEIYVPPQLVRILKEYTKAVVRAKPSDLLLWSATYFRNLASGQSPEKKERLHIFDPAAGGLSQAVIRLMYLKLKEKETVVVGDLKDLWKELKLDSSLLLELFRKSCIPQDEENEVNWMKMLALATAVISENLKDTMRKFLEVVGDTTSKPGMTLPAVEEIFQFLAEVDGVSSSSIEDAIHHLREIGQNLHSSSMGDAGGETTPSSDHPMWSPIVVWSYLLFSFRMVAAACGVVLPSQTPLKMDEDFIQKFRSLREKQGGFISSDFQDAFPDM